VPKAFQLSYVTDNQPKKKKKPTKKAKIKTEEQIKFQKGE